VLRQPSIAPAARTRARASAVVLVLRLGGCAGERATERALEHSRVKLAAEVVERRGHKLLLAARGKRGLLAQPLRVGERDLEVNDALLREQEVGGGRGGSGGGGGRRGSERATLLLYKRKIMEAKHMKFRE